MGAMAETRKTTKRSGAKKSSGFTDDERAAMRERVQEMKAEKRRSKGGAKADGESDVLAKIAEMPEADRKMAEQIHAIVKKTAPELEPRTWYGMPAYSKDGNVICFFQSAAKFKSRYATFGFNNGANLDDGNVWPVAFALKKLTRADEARIRELVKQAVS